MGLKNCEVVDLLDVKGANFRIVPTEPCTPHCCVVGFASIKAKVSACVMTNSIEVSKC